jgi:signal transduction histidine kinase
MTSQPSVFGRAAEAGGGQGVAGEPGTILFEGEPGVPLMPPHGVRVLVADDDPAVRRALQRILTRGGFEVVIADDVGPALTAAQAAPPELALVDLSMPTSGLELVRQLKAAFGEAIHVAVLSGVTSDEVQDRCIEAGADEYLVKSVSAATLCRHLVAAARKQRAFVESRRARDHAERLHAYGAEAASLLAHDLNNSLATAVLEVELLAHELHLDGPQRESLAGTRYALQRMTALVSNFVDIARFEEECLHPDLREVVVRELVDAVMRTHRQAAPAATFRVDCPAELIGLFDRALIERVLHNLVGNAARHTPAGGEIHLTATTVESPGHTGGVAIMVHNSGPAVEPALAARLFSKYARGRTGRRGMGLYFCRLVCETHGGSVTLHNGAGGPTFRIDLPGRATG